jgi:hypothetical protein
MILMVLLMIALFHLFLYYWNMDTLLVPKPTENLELNDTKAVLEKHLNELKQYNCSTKNG